MDHEGKQLQGFPLKKDDLKYWSGLKFEKEIKQAGTELGQAQLKLELDFNFLYIWFLWIHFNRLIFVQI